MIRVCQLGVDQARFLKAKGQAANILDAQLFRAGAGVYSQFIKNFDCLRAETL